MTTTVEKKQTGVLRGAARTVPAQEASQYTLRHILGIWAAVTIPMGLPLWVILPLAGPRLDFDPGLLYYFLILAGLVWQGVFAYIILRREVRPFTWQGVKDRLWLHTPSDPRTGRPTRWLYLWTIPLSILAHMAFEKLSWLNNLWVQAFPFLAPPSWAQIQSLGPLAPGQWWLLGTLAVQLLFNYLLGEELIFRGILLPKMSGVFGKWDFLANHILFSLYHLHLLWNTPSRLIIDLLFVVPTRRFKSYWLGAIIHGSDSLFLIYMFIMAIKGLV